MDRTIIVLAVVLGIVALEGLALTLGYNGDGLRLVVLILGGLGGFELRGRLDLGK